jgi:hypothetical protein
MLEKIERELNNLISWFGQLHMKVEALETKVYGSPIDQPRKVITPEEAKLKPDCPGYTECKEMLINLQRENAEIKKLNHLITLDLDNELMESAVMVSIIKENEQMKAEIKRLQKVETKLINKLDLIYNTVVNSSRD